MSDERADAITRIEGNAAGAALRAAAAAHHDRPRQAPSEAAPAPPPPATAPAPRATELAFDVDAELQQIVVRVLDRNTGEVVRAFPLQLPGTDAASDETPPRGALIDAKA
jgi:hypothetical protein